MICYTGAMTKKTRPRHMNPRQPDRDLPGVRLDPITGRHLERGILRVRPIRSHGRTAALSVKVETELGTVVVEIRATEAEVQTIEVPRPPDGLARAPGAVWFYDAAGGVVGFLPDLNAGTLKEPLAVMAPRRGPTSPQKAADA